MDRLRITRRDVPVTRLTRLRNFHAVQSALYRGDLDVTIEGPQWPDPKIRRDVRTPLHRNQNPEQSYAQFYALFSNSRAEEIDKEDVRGKLPVEWDGFRLHLIKILGAGGFGAATLWEVTFEDGSKEKYVIKMGLSRNFSAEGEFWWHHRYRGNEHVVGAIDLHAEAQKRRAEYHSAIGAPGSKIPHMFRGQKFDPQALNVLVLEYAEGGDLLGLLGKAGDQDVRFSNKQLWEFWECLVLGICSVAFQPALHEENPNMSFDQYLEAAKEMVPLDEIGDYFSELQVGHDVHFDMEEQNILVGCNNKHAHRPVMKLHDFGDVYSFDMDTNWGNWNEDDYWLARIAPKQYRLAPEQVTKDWDYLAADPAYNGDRFRGPDFSHGCDVAGRYGAWTNVFRIADIMKSIATGIWKHYPFNAKPYRTVIGTEEVSYGWRLGGPEFSWIEPELRDTICQCLFENPAERPHLHELLEQLLHRQSLGFEEDDDETAGFWTAFFAPRAPSPIDQLGPAGAKAVRMETEATNPNTPERVAAQRERDNAGSGKGKGKAVEMSWTPGTSQKNFTVKSGAPLAQKKKFDRDLPEKYRGLPKELIPPHFRHLYQSPKPVQRLVDLKRKNAVRRKPALSYLHGRETVMPATAIRVPVPRPPLNPPRLISLAESSAEAGPAPKPTKDTGPLISFLESDEPLLSFLDSDTRPAIQAMQNSRPFMDLLVSESVNEDEDGYARVTIAVPEGTPEPEEEDDNTTSGARSRSAWTSRSTLSTAATSLGVGNPSDVRMKDIEDDDEEGDDYEDEDDDEDGQDPHYREQPAKRQRRSEPESSQFFQPRPAQETIGSGTRRAAPRLGTRTSFQYARSVNFKPHPPGQPPVRPLFTSASPTTGQFKATQSTNAQPTTSQPTHGQSTTKSTMQPTAQPTTRRRGRLARPRPSAAAWFEDTPQPSRESTPQPARQPTPQPVPQAWPLKRLAKPTKPKRLLEIGKDLTPITTKKPRKPEPKPVRIDKRTEQLEQYVRQNLSSVPVAIRNLVSRSNAIEATMAQRVAEREEQRQNMVLQRYLAERRVREEQGLPPTEKKGKQKEASESESD